MTAAYPIDPEQLTIATETATELGTRYAERYQSAAPYNHICIDDFLPPSIIENVRSDLSSLEDAERSFDGTHEKLKSQYSPDRLPEYTRHLFQAFNSRPFIRFLEEMTGITGLIPDPYFIGAGIHKTLNGGFLDIHADFNLHKRMRVERRLNILIYLNHDWKEEYGGCFEVWDKEMKTKAASFVPTANRMVCFSTASDTFHGNPEPVNHPEGEARQSIALYYYTATWDDTRFEHSTLFKPRPGTQDADDARHRRRNALKEVLPPVVFRKVIKPLGRIGF